MTTLPRRLQVLLAGRDKSRNPRQCLCVELAQKQTMMHYQPQASRLFLKIVLSVPNLVTPCRSKRRGRARVALAEQLRLSLDLTCVPVQDCLKRA